jgi:hypothetical protein
MERMDTRVSESLHKLSRTTSALADTIDNGITVAKRVGKQSSDAIEEFMDDTALRIKRHPAETVAGAFAAGVVAGGFLDWMLRRR